MAKLYGGISNPSTGRSVVWEKKRASPKINIEAINQEENVRHLVEDVEIFKLGNK